MKAKLITTVCALMTGAAFAATSYVVPWEVNPTLMARLAVTDASGSSLTGFSPVSLDLSSDGAWLAFSVAADGAQNVRALKTDSFSSVTDGSIVAVASIMGVSDSLGLGSAPFVLATGGSLDATLAIDTANGVAKILPNGGTAYQSWTKRKAPKSVTVSGASLENVAAMAIAMDGTTGVSCAKTGGALTMWTLSATTLTAGATTLATGLDTISSVAVYTIGKPNKAKTTYAVVGEANGSAGTAGQIRLVNLATGTATTLLTDSANLGGGVAAVRMSLVDTFRPRLYALTTAGDLFCYYLSEDLATVTATYSYTNAELLGFAQAPFAADAARVTAFDVSADGGTLVVGYAATSDATPTEAMTLAVIRHTARAWTYAQEDGKHYISDGNWKLLCYKDGSNLVIGNAKDGTTKGSGYANDYVGEFLDLSAGVATSETGGSGVSIVGHRSSSLGVTTTHAMPRVIIFSPKTSSSVLGQFMKGWDTIEEVVISASGITSIDSWSGTDDSLKLCKVVLDLPGLTSMSDNAIYSSVKQWFGDDTDASQWNLPALKTLGGGNFSRMDVRGVLKLPAVTTIGGNVCDNCHYLEELWLGAEAKTVTSIGGKSFRVTEQNDGEHGSVGRLKKLVIGGVAAGFTINQYAFYGQPLEEVVFTGGVPTFASGFAFSDTAARTMFFAVPRGDANWQTALDGKVTALTDDERRTIQNAHPDRPVPFGVVAKDVFCTANEQYVCYDDERAGVSVTIDHDTFFGDAVEVTSDWAPAADGTYLAGTTLTLTPKASAGGVFTKWYGDVPRADETATPLTLVVTNDVWIYARFTHPWTLSDDRKTASNGNFTINCTVVDEAARTLAAGKAEKSGLFADADEGEGVLDLGGAVTDGEENAWTFAAWAEKEGLFVRPKDGKGNATTLLSPGTITGGLPYYQLFNTSKANGTGQKSYRTIIFDEPAMTGGWVSWNMSGQKDLSRLVLRTPGLQKMQGQTAFDSTLADTNFDWWDLSGVTVVSPGTFKGVAAVGTLRLPSLTVVEKGSTSNWLAPLGQLKKAEGIVLGGLKKRTTVTSIGEKAFFYGSAPRTLAIHNAANLTVGAKPFDGGTTPSEITFTGKAVNDSGAAFANLTAGVTAAETKPVVIYASDNYGWGKIDYIDQDVTDADRAQVPGERILGVYRGGAAAPLGKALVVHRASPYDPRGLLVIIR